VHIELHNNLTWFLVVGGFAGWVASQMVQGGEMGIIADIGVGTLGAFLGSWIMDFFGLNVGGFWGELLMWVLGSVLLLVLFKAVAGKSRSRATA
jgi:uncharacterized membrane protein YeaQ/YmgE (transglycosylase-associated protein family)